MRNVYFQHSRGDWLGNSANIKGLNNSAVGDVEQTRHVTLTVHKFKMADGVDDLFVWGEDFEAILGILEDDEEVEEEFSVAVRNAQRQEIVCNDCGKKYKTKGGYERHRAAKHDNQKEGLEQVQQLSPSVLAEIVDRAIRNVKERRVFAKKLRNELSNYSYQQLQEDRNEFSAVKAIYEGYTRNGDAEKFYGKYYSTVAAKSIQFFSGISRNAATLLATKVADCLLAYSKQQKHSTESSHHIKTVLSDKEKAGMQYLGGYVLHNLHKKHGRTNPVESQQAMAILKAEKLESVTDSSQKLVSALNHGGLWPITQPAQQLFLKVEYIFRQFTSKPDLQRLDISGITNKATSDSDILAYYNLMVSDAELEPDSHVCKDVLHGIVSLYVHVRSFSFAKDIIQHYKIKTTQTKARALRKEINRSCQGDDQQRQE